MSSELRLLMSFSWPCFPGVIWTRFFSPHGFPGFWDSIPKRCKGVHCVYLGESFPTSIFLQNLVSIQLKTSPETSEFDFRITQRFNFPMVFSPLKRTTLRELRERFSEFERACDGERIRHCVLCPKNDLFAVPVLSWNSK